MMMMRSGKQHPTVWLAILIFAISGAQASYWSAWLHSSGREAFWHLAESALDSLNQPVCYGEFGCFNKTEVPTEFQILEVANLAACYPEHPEKVNTHFGVFSCRNRYNPTVLGYNFTEDQLNGINFDPTKRTIVVAHGYTDHYDQFNWMGDLKDTILRRDPCQLNVIVVDWRGGSKTSPNYLQAVANTRLVGAMIARMVKRFGQHFNLTNDHFTLIGHSLGGHIVGFAGKRLQRPDKVRLIISLDPAGPAFHNVSHESRISPDDGRLVIAIHTNGGENIADGFGLAQPVGHYDFYPNGGESQPGCDVVNGVTQVLISGLAEGLSDSIACSHRRAYDLLIYDESHYDDYQTMAYTCANHSDFKAGKCAHCREGTDDCMPFGSWFDYWQEQRNGPLQGWMAPIHYFVDTWQMVPYSYFQYQIKVTTDADFKPFTGQMLINMTGSLRRDFIEMIRLDDKFQPNQEYYYLHKSRKSIGRVEKMNVTLVPGTFQRATTASVGQSIVNKVSGLFGGGGGGGNGGTGNDAGTDQKELKAAFVTVREIQANYMNGHRESIRKERSARLQHRGEMTTNGTNTKRGMPGVVRVTDKSLFLADGLMEKPGQQPTPVFGQRDSNVNNN